MMKRIRILAAVLTLAAALPALAQQAPGSEEVFTPRTPQTSPRAVLPRDLMTPGERAFYRAYWESATPAERVRAWGRLRAVLYGRAAERGVSLAMPLMRADGTFVPVPEAQVPGSHMFREP